MLDERKVRKLESLEERAFTSWSKLCGIAFALGIFMIPTIMILVWAVNYTGASPGQVVGCLVFFAFGYMLGKERPSGNK